MKKTICLFLLLYSFNSWAQSILNDNNVSYYYELRNLGSYQNPETKTTFNKYQIQAFLVNKSRTMWLEIPFTSINIKKYHREFFDANPNGKRSNEVFFQSFDQIRLQEDGCYNRYDCKTGTKIDNNGFGAVYRGFAPGKTYQSEQLTFYVPPGYTPRMEWSDFRYQQFCAGDVKEPEKKQNTANTQPAQWSGWDRTGCYQQLEYRFKTVELYNLNYQVHMYFEVRSRYNDAVTFNFNLLDQNNRVQFGEQRSISGGGTIEFVHKMDSKKIASISIANVKTRAGKVLSCNGDDSQNSNQTGNNSGNSGNNQGGNTQEPSSVSGGDVNDKIAAINVHLNKIPGDDNEAQVIINDAGNITNSNLSDREKAARLDPLITRAKNRANSLSSSRKQADDAQSAAETVREREAQAAKEQAKREADAKANRFNGFMSKGDNALSANKFDEAESNYNQAFSMAATEADGQRAVDGINRARKGKADAARVVRTDNKKAREKEVDTQAAAATAGAVALMALLSDRYDDKPVNFRAQVGLGLESIPIILNSQFSKRSTIETTFHYSVMMGLKLGIANHKGVSFHLNPVFYGGFNAGSKGTDGTHTGYGGFGTLQMGLKAESKFKLYAEGGWLGRGGNYNYDGDVASGGTTANDDVRKGTYDYSLTRFGGGVMLHFINDPHETYIKAGIYFEKLSFAPQKPQMVGSLQINISSQIVIDFLYSKNYAIAGKADYPNSLTTSSSIFPELNNRSYFSIRIIRQGMF